MVPISARSSWPRLPIRFWLWTSITTRSSTYLKATRALGLIVSSSTASTSSTTHVSRVSSGWRIWFLTLSSLSLLFFKQFVCIFFLGHCFFGDLGFWWCRRLILRRSVLLRTTILAPSTQFTATSSTRFPWYVLRVHLSSSSSLRFFRNIFVSLFVFENYFSLIFVIFFVFFAMVGYVEND